MNHCSSRRIALTLAKYLQIDSLFPTLRSRCYPGENALASPLVLLLAGCASYLPHLYPVQLSYPLALLKSCISASVWNRTITHRKDQYVLTHECLRTMARSFDFLCVGACTDIVLQVHENAKAWLKMNSKNCIITHCVLASALDHVGKGGWHHCRHGQSEYSGGLEYTGI